MEWSGVDNWSGAKTVASDLHASGGKDPSMLPIFGTAAAAGPSLFAAHSLSTTHGTTAAATVLVAISMTMRIHTSIL